MSGSTTSNWAWYQLGQWSADADVADARSANLPYINQLEYAYRGAQHAADHNFQKGKEWIAKAQRLDTERDALESRISALKTELAALRETARLAIDALYKTDADANRDIASARAELATEREAHRKTAIERDGMQRFLSMATRLLRVESPGKAATPEYAEMRELVLEISDTLNRGEPFHGFHKTQPEKFARMRELYVKLYSE